MKHRLIRASLITLAATASGCATVNPRPDYDRAAEKVEAATGYCFEYRPENDACTQQRVCELLEGGLTADEAVHVCLLNNRKIQAALYEIGAARADLVQAGLLSNPTLAIAGKFPDSGGLTKIEAAVVQNIANLWQIPTRKRVACSALERVILQVARDASIAAYDAKAAYYQAKQADRKCELAAESIQVARHVLDLALTRQEAGAGSEIDVNLARAEVHSAELAFADAKLAALAARSALARQLSLPSAPEELELTDPLPELPHWCLDEEALLLLAADRLDIQAAASAVKAAVARIKEEKLKLFPNVEIGLAFERDERRAPEGRNILADSVLASIAERAPTVEIAPIERLSSDTLTGPSIGLELPIFNQNQGNIARAEYACQQNLKLLDDVVLAATQDVRLAAAQARAAWKVLDFYRDEVLPLRETSLDLARTAYQAGRTPLHNVLETERALLTARVGYVDSLGDCAAALVELEKAVGQPLQRILPAAGRAANEMDMDASPGTEAATQNSGEVP